VQTRKIQKEKKQADLPTDSVVTYHLKKPLGNFLEDFYVAPAKNEKVVQDYIEYL
jgi:hypothetical protein